MTPLDEIHTVEKVPADCPPGIVMGEVQLILDIKRKYSSVADLMD